MANYARPYREKGVPSTAKYAAPAIVTLVRMLLESGSVVADLETHLIGGGSNPEAEGYQEGLGDQNVKVGLELLDKLNLSSVDMDVGGNWGRKVVFHSATGELVLARVERIRSSDWYPQ
ncbi:MAG: chemotaxis protein CheD [Desulfovibrionaceae bacterium]